MLGARNPDGRRQLTSVKSIWILIPLPSPPKISGPHVQRLVVFGGTSLSTMVVTLGSHARCFKLGFIWCALHVYNTPRGWSPFQTRFCPCSCPRDETQAHHDLLSRSPAIWSMSRSDSGGSQTSRPPFSIKGTYRILNDPCSH